MFIEPKEFLREILAFAGEVYLPFLAANSAALDAGQKGQSIYDDCKGSIYSRNRQLATKCKQLGEVVKKKLITSNIICGCPKGGISVSVEGGSYSAHPAGVQVPTEVLQEDKAELCRTSSRSEGESKEIV